MTGLLTGVLSIVIAYVLGSIPFGYLLTRYATGKDVRQAGSGNIGATNVMRTAGRRLGIATLVLDSLKGFLAVWIAAVLTDGDPGWMANAALAVMAGHAFPLFLHFKGGKTVATFIGAFLLLTPVPLLASLVVFIVVVAATRYISAGSMIAAASFPLGVWIILHPSLTVDAAAIIAAAFIVYRHWSNLERIRAGTERVFCWRTP